MSRLYHSMKVVQVSLTRPPHQSHLAYTLPVLLPFPHILTELSVCHAIISSPCRSAAELFRLNTGRTLAMKKRKGRDGKRQLASTAQIVEAAATKLTNMHNSKQSSGGLSKSRDLSSSSLLPDRQDKANRAPLIEKDFQYKGARYPFTSQHFQSDTQQWRLIFLFHNFLDVEV